MAFARVPCASLSKIERDVGVVIREENVHAVLTPVFIGTSHHAIEPDAPRRECKARVLARETGFQKGGHGSLKNHLANLLWFPAWIAQSARIAPLGILCYNSG